MKEKQPRRKDCMPSLVYPDTLMTGQWDFMNWERIKQECACIHSKTCNQICETLLNNKPQVALEMIRDVRNQILNLDK
jgi:hypothetical protein